MANRTLDEIIAEMKRISQLEYEELNAEFKTRFEICSKLGSYGWVPHGSLIPSDFPQWLHRIESRGEEDIATDFSENAVNDMIDRIMNVCHMLPERMYADKGFDHYFAGHYTEAALFLLPLLDYRYSKTTKFGRDKWQRLKNGLPEVKQQLFDTLKPRPMTRIIVEIDDIPAFTAFAARLFTEDEKYKFGTGTEPPYLNRDWLMHGRMTRRVKRYEIIQLINGLNTWLDIEEELDRG